MKTMKRLLPLIALSALCACAPGQIQTRTDLDLEEMKRRLATLERSLQTLKEGQGVTQRMDALGRAQAELKADLDAVRVDLQSLSGQLEERSHKISEVRSQLEMTQDELGIKTAALEERLDRLEAAAQKAPQAPPVAPTAEPSPQPPAQAPPAAGPDAETLYKQALEKVQHSTAYPEAVALFQEFLARYPKHDLAVNAYYWIGEAYYGEKNFEKAIVQFQDVIQKFPQHGKAPAAMLKQALAFLSLNDAKSAKVILQKLVQTYPDSEAASRARERLKTLN